jgi:hypothetical protein
MLDIIANESLDFGSTSSGVDIDNPTDEKPPIIVMREFEVNVKKEFKDQG